VAVSEVDNHDIWQSTRLGIVSIASASHIIESCFSGLERFIENNYPVEITSFTTEML